MKKIRLLIAAALFVCVISAVSCGGASAAGTATVSDNQGVFETVRSNPARRWLQRAS